MAERYYTSMCRHVLRYYCKNPDGPSRDVESWNAVHAVLNRLSDSEREIVLDIHGNGETVMSAIQRLSRERRCDAKRLWDLMNYVDRAIAKEMRWT